MMMSVWVLSVQSGLLDVDNNGMKRGIGDSWRIVQLTSHQVPTRKRNSVVSDKKYHYSYEALSGNLTTSTQRLINSKQQKFEIYTIKGNMVTNKY